MSDEAIEDRGVGSADADPTPVLPWRDWFAKYSALLVLAGLMIGFGLAMPDLFPTVQNFQLLTNQQVVAGVLAFALLLPIVAGEFDFSCGAMLSAASVLLVKLLGMDLMPWPLAVVVILVGAAAVGLVNGFLVAVAGFHSFVATLATSGIIGGAALMVSNGETLFQGIPEDLSSLGQKIVVGVPLLVIATCAVYGVIAWILRQTAWGRQHEAIGKGRRAAQLAGVNVRRHVMVSFAGSAMLAALAGCMLVAQLGSAPANVGFSYILAGFSAVFLGAAILRPGFFNATGTLVAIVLLAVGQNGLALLGISSFVEQVFTGCVLVVAVGLSQLGSRARK